MASGSGPDAKGIDAIVAAVFGILVLFLMVLLIGEPIPAFGGKASSFAYSIVVYVPVALVCLLALAKARRNR